jgi:hypothetical protein
VACRHRTHFHSAVTVTKLFFHVNTIYTKFFTPGILLTLHGGLWENWNILPEICDKIALFFPATQASLIEPLLKTAARGK